MPELKDVDDNYIYWQPDGGGSIQKTARTPQTEQMFGAENFQPMPIGPGTPDIPAAAFAPTAVSAPNAPEGVTAPTQGGGVPPAMLPDPSVTVTNTPGAPVDPSVKVTHSPDATDLNVASADKASTSMPLPAPTGPTGEKDTTGQPQAPTPPQAAPAPQAGAPAPAAGAKPAATGTSSKGELFRAMRAEEGAQKDLVTLQAQAEDEKAFQMATDAGAQNKVMADQAIKTADRDRSIKEGLAHLDVLNKDVREGKIDPDGYFNDRGTAGGIASRIGAAIAVGLGQFAASMTGGQNNAMAIINSAVQQHVDAQKANLKQKSVAADAQRDKLGMLRQQGFDEAQSDQALFLGGLEAAKAKLNATIQASASDVVRANGAKLLAEMDQNIAATKVKFEQAAQAAALKYQPKSFDDLLKKQRLDHDMTQDKREREIRLADGTRAFTHTKDDATALKSSDENRIGMVGNIQRLKQIVANKSSWTDKDTRDEAKRITSELVTSYGVMKKLGALSESDRELADQFRNPNALFTGDKHIIDSLDKYEGRVNAGHNAMLQARLVTE